MNVNGVKRFLTQISITPLLIGGRIFYDNGSNGATYTFYDANENVISTQTVDGLASAKYYFVEGTPTKDRWYVYDNTLKSNLQWGKYRTEIGITYSDGIGKGKTNTTTALTKTGWESDSIFAYIQTMRTNKVGGCDDWFIGSKAEQDKLRASGLVTWYKSNFIWSSVEDSKTDAFVWDSDDTFWDTSIYGDKNQKYCCFGMRSF